MSEDLVQILDGNTFVVSDARGDIEASLTDPTGLFSVRHPLPLEVGAHRRRRASEPAFGRRPAVLRVAFLPRSRDRNRLRGRQAVGDPAPRGRRRVPRGADDPQPRREARRPDRARRGRLRLRRPVRGQGRFEEERQVLDDDREGPPRPRLPARHVQARDHDLRVDPRQDRRGGTHVQGARRAARLVVDRPRRRHRHRGGRRIRPPEVQQGRQGAAEHGAKPRALARRRAEARVRLGSAEVDVPTQPHRPRRAPVLAAGRRRPKPPRRRAAVVHDDVRPRQHLHEPPGAPVHAGARSDDAARARRLAGRAGRRLPRRGSRAGSSTRCATAR